MVAAALAAGLIALAGACASGDPSWATGRGEPGAATSAAAEGTASGSGATASAPTTTSAEDGRDRGDAGAGDGSGGDADPDGGNPDGNPRGDDGAADAFARPDWLGTRELPVRPDGFGEIQPTPPELVDRRLATPEHLPPPPDDGFHHDVGPVPAEVAERSTWQPDCPVALEDLAYVTLSHWGFDGGHHTGELVVHAEAAEGIVAVFARLHEARFPIEEMRVVAPEELDAPPTGDGNNTTAFVCRPVVGSSSWSQHAYGLAIDINPFHNPYRKGDVVLPELASAYVDRDDLRPGMIVEGDVVTEAFGALGWGWGGRWGSLKDWMHFSATGR